MTAVAASPPAPWFSAGPPSVFSSAPPTLLHIGLAFISFYHDTYHQPHRIITVTLLLSLLRQTVNSSRSGHRLIYLYLLSNALLGIWQSSLNLVWVNSHTVGSLSWFRSYLKYCLFKKDVLTPRIGSCASQTQPVLLSGFTSLTQVITLKLLAKLFILCFRTKEEHCENRPLQVFFIALFHANSWHIVGA